MRARADSGPFPGPGYVRVPSGLASADPYRTPGLVDAYGNPYRAPVDPLKGRDSSHAGRVFRDLAPSPSINWCWTPDAIKGAINAHMMGLFVQSSGLIDQMTGMDRITSALGSRVGALLGLEEVYKQADADTDGACLAAWKSAWPKCHAPIGQGDTIDPIRREALMAGFSVSEIVWDTSEEPWQPYLKPWPLEYVIRNPVTRSLVAVTEDGLVDIVPGDGRWFVHAPGGIYRGYQTGLFRSLALPWLLHCLARRDWARYSERHGMPIILAKVPAVGDARDKERFESDLETMGTEAIAVLPQGLDGEGYDLDLLEATAQTWEGFDRLMMRCESSITIAVQWQNLTTEVKEGGLNAARVHADVKQSAIALDDRVWADDVEQQIARPFALWNYGSADKAPRTSRDLEVLEDQVQRCTALNMFAQAVASFRTSGDPIDVEALARAYRIKLPIGAARSNQPQIFAYHLAAAVVKRNEMRARLGLPPDETPAGEEYLSSAPAAAGVAP